MPSPQITLYFDICNVSFVPISLGGLMKSCNNTPPIYIKNKSVWIGKERMRWAQYFSVPIVDKTPEGFPPLTLPVQRALAAISEQAPEKLVPATDALYRVLWVEGNGKIAQPEVFVPILEKVLGAAAAQQIVEMTSKPEIKSLLIANTDRAFKAGAFGIPWFECTNASGEKESFWGIDHLGQVLDFLGLDRSLDEGFRACL